MRTKYDMKPRVQLFFRKGCIYEVEDLFWPEVNKARFRLLTLRECKDFNIRERYDYRLCVKDYYVLVEKNGFEARMRKLQRELDIKAIEEKLHQKLVESTKLLLDKPLSEAELKENTKEAIRAFYKRMYPEAESIDVVDKGDGELGISIGYRLKRAVIEGFIDPQVLRSIV